MAFSNKYKQVVIDYFYKFMNDTANKTKPNYLPKMYLRVSKITIMLIISVSTFCHCELVHRGVAENIADNWYSYIKGKSLNDNKVEKIEEIQSESNVCFYAITFVDGGFVLVAGDDSSIPILGYSLKSRIIEYRSIPAVRDMFEFYKEQIDIIISDGLRNNETKQLWDDISENNFSLFSRTRNVSPLIASEWNQNWPYNELCPEDNNGSGGHVYAGCVATAMGQIMNYWDHPTTGNSSHGYTHPTYGYQYADFSSTTYEWGNMPDNISVSNTAIATLLYHCAVSVDMDFAPDGSGAYSSDAMAALGFYFNYSPNMQLLWKDDYSDSDWENLLRADLDNSRPIYYRGQGSGGHAFVCDGYQLNNYFHFNWGWSGSYNGYFYLSALNPGSHDFSTLQGAITGIEPTQDTYDSWEILSSMPTPRYGPGVASVDGLVYVIGGYGDTGDTNIVEIYNPADDTWSLGSPAPVKRRTSAVEVNDMIYIVGGNSQSNRLFQFGGVVFNSESEDRREAVAETYLYNPLTDTWSQKMSLPEPIQNPGLVYNDGYIYAIGGWSTSVWSSKIYRYTVATDSWAYLTDMPVPKAYPAAGVINDKIYIAGGISSSDSLDWLANGTNSIVYEFDITTQIFTEKASIPTPRYNAGSVVANNKLYVIGGDQFYLLSDDSTYSHHYFNSTEVYDPATDLWTQLEGMPTTRGWLGSAVVNNKIYNIGGYYYDFLNSNEVFTIADTPTITHFIPIWADTPYLAMNVYVTSATLDGVDLEAGDEIGIFDGSICVGAGVLSETIPTGDYFAMIASTDDPTTPEIDGFTVGNAITFAAWDTSAEVESGLCGSIFSVGDGTFSSLGTAMVDLACENTVEQLISLSTGWNIFSLYVEPEITDMDSILAPVIDNDCLVKVQDEAGNAIEILPFPIGWINNIGNWQATEAYYARLSCSFSLPVQGSYISLPIDIPLVNGWNLLPFPLPQCDDAMSIVQGLINSGELVKVQDESGNAIEQLPAPVGWINNINNFCPGQGYYIRTNTATSLTYSDPGRNSDQAVQTPVQPESKYYLPVYQNNPYLAMNIYVLDDQHDNTLFKNGFELAVFDNDICVGATSISESSFYKGYITIIASKDDPYTPKTIDGFISGHDIQFRLWDGYQEQTLVNKEGDIYYESQGTGIADLATKMTVNKNAIPESFALYDCYPNPFNPRTTIAYDISLACQVTVLIHDMLGREIRHLVNEFLEPGRYQISWNGLTEIGEPAPSGIYFYTISSDNFLKTKKMILMK